MYDLICNIPRNAVGISNPCGNLSGRCGVSPLEGVASNEVRARGRLSPPLKNKLKGDKLNG